MDPLSVTASLLAVITAAVQSTRSLYETIKSFRDRDKTLRKLLDELDGLTTILASLKQIINAETSMLTLLQGPIDRCSQVCREFEQSMKTFSGKSKMGIRDWTKMEFMKGDINEFIDTIEGYKSTITVGIGTITMHTSKVSHKVLEEYNDMIMDTAYNLELRLQRIDEKMTRLNIDKSSASDMHISVDLDDERAVTKQCIRICEDARTYIESLQNRESAILQDPVQNNKEDDEMRKLFEAQLLTRQTLHDHQNKFTEVIGHLGGRLQSLIMNEDPKDNKDRTRLQGDINILKQCLEVCKMASEVSNQKIYRVGEAVADGNSDQVVVTTLADLFNVNKALSKDNSLQLVGSMGEESLRHLADKRYNSRFGAVAVDPNQVGVTNAS